MRNPLPCVVLVCLAGIVSAQTTEIRFNASGHGCGPELAGSAVTLAGQHQVTLAATRALPNEGCLFVLGLQEARLTIPVYGCELFLGPLVATVAPANASGRAELAFPLSASLVGTIHTQAASFRLVPNELFASNALAIETRRQ